MTKFALIDPDVHAKYFKGSYTKYVKYSWNERKKQPLLKQEEAACVQ